MLAPPGVLLAHEEDTTKMASVEGSREESNGSNPASLEREANRVVEELKIILDERIRLRQGKCEFEDIDHCEAGLTKLLVNADQLAQSMKMSGVAIEPITQCIKGATTMLAQLGTFRDDLKTRLSGHTDHGTAIYYRLLVSGDMKSCPDGLGESVATESIVALHSSPRCSPRDQKQQVVDFYTPMLMDIVKEASSDLRLVGIGVDDFFCLYSEGNRIQFVMPELFTAHRSLIRYSSTSSVNLPACDVKRFIGKLVCSDLRESVNCIWNATWEIDMQTFGELCKNLAIIQSDGALDVTVRGVVFDKDEFWMVKYGRYEQEVEKCGWRQPGSRGRLVMFLRPSDPWMEAARILCNDLGVSIEEYRDGDHEHSACVWSKRTRRVFRLVDGRMLKMAVGFKSGIDDFEREHELMVQYGQREDISSFVLPVVEGSYRSGKVGEFHYGGYLLGEGGQLVAYLMSVEQKRAVAVALYGLHSHGVVLGSGSFDSAVVRDGAVKWIDFSVSNSTDIKKAIEHDVSNVIWFQCLGDRDSEGIAAYVNDLSLERLVNVLLSVE